MSNDESTHVQTELTREEYRAFREVALERGLTIKEAGHEAIRGWIDSQQRANPQDPAFTVLDELDEESLPRTAATDARTEDDLVAEWTGDDAVENYRAMASSTDPSVVDDEVRRLYERYQSAETDEERHEIALEMGALDGRRYAELEQE